MKDFYDIWFLTKTRKFDRNRLMEAIEVTFKKRNTEISDIKLIFEDEFVQDSNKSKQWAAFLRRISIEEQVSFEFVMEDLKAYFSKELNLIKFD